MRTGFGRWCRSTRLAWVLAILCCAAAGWGAEVDIPDANLRAAVERALGKESGAAITDEEMESLTSLDASGSRPPPFSTRAVPDEIADLRGIEHAVNLESLTLSSNRIVDLEPLEDLAALLSLNLAGNRIADVASLAGLAGLVTLDLSFNRITDVEPLRNLTALSSLAASFNQIQDVEPIAGLTGLTSLDLRANRAIADVSPLAGLTRLSRLNLAGNRIADIAPLGSLTGLSELNLSNNRIAGGLGVLAGLTGLSSLDLGGNRISALETLPSGLRTLHLNSNDIVDLQALESLTTLTRLWLFGNKIEDLAPLGALTGLAVLLLDDNNITDVSPLRDLTSVLILGLQHNRITDVGPLAGMARLYDLRLAGNRIVDVSPLAEMASLRSLNLTGNNVADVSPLASAPALSSLFLGSNQLTDLTSLADLTGLSTLWLDGNAVADVSPLAAMTQLGSLALNDNAVVDVSPLAALTQLSHLALSDNRVVDISSLAELANLTRLELGQNEIVDISRLEELDRLHWLALEGNAITDIAPLGALASLSSVYLWDNRITDIRSLVDNAGIGANDLVLLWRNPLDARSQDGHIADLEARDVRVIRSGHDVPFIPVAADETRQGFVRVVEAGGPQFVNTPVWIHAVDDLGDGRTPVQAWFARGFGLHFNSNDLEFGNRAKFASGAAGTGVGGWRLGIYSELALEVSAYLRTRDGFLTSMNALAPPSADGYRIATFNPGRNKNQVSSLRLANPGYESTDVIIRGVDDDGAPSAGAVRVSLAPGEARALTAEQLESGENLDGALGSGAGKWRLELATDAPIQAMSLLESPTGHLTNLSSVPDNATVLADGTTRHGIPLFPAADDPLGRQGFARVVNQGTAPATVEIVAIDDAGVAQPPATLTVAPGTTVHFNSDDLEGGNADKGLSSGITGGDGHWRLRLTTVADIEVLSYIRTEDGFLTAMHDTVPGVEDPAGGHVHEVAIFNPGGNRNQVSRLRVINDGRETAEITVTGIDDLGASSRRATPVRFTVPGGHARTVTAQELESGDGLDAGLGDGAGKWRLRVHSDEPVGVVNLLASPTGHLTNLSDARRRYESP
ncbi:MAG: leucine-rich repeat domain-containing protein [Gammaproteobacteria bacterium]|nr:leucine-rich repeat domain-containing protein [Gammaproteobacteria bacterium]